MGDVNPGISPRSTRSEKDGMSRTGSMDTMNAFELLSRMDSFADLSQDTSGTSSLTVQANRDAGELRTLLEAELGKRGFALTPSGERTTCSGRIGELGSATFALEARPVIDEVS